MFPNFCFLSETHAITDRLSSVETGNLKFKKRSRFNLALTVNSTPEQGCKTKQRRFIMQSDNIVN